MNSKKEKESKRKTQNQIEGRIKLEIISAVIWTRALSSFPSFACHQKKVKSYTCRHIDTKGK
jgi:hypothetical protein